MDKKQLSKAIEEGINKSHPVVFLKMLLFTLLILGVTYIVINFVYDTYFFKDCFETGKCSIDVVSPCDQLGLKDLDCHVVIGNDSMDFYNTYLRRVCGYQEANALYKYYKPIIEKDLKDNLKIKYLECD